MQQSCWIFYFFTSFPMGKKTGLEWLAENTTCSQHFSRQPHPSMGKKCCSWSLERVRDTKNAMAFVRDICTLLQSQMICTLYTSVTTWTKDVYNQSIGPVRMPKLKEGKVFFTPTQVVVSRVKNKCQVSAPRVCTLYSTLTQSLSNIEENGQTLRHIERVKG